MHSLVLAKIIVIGYAVSRIVRDDVMPVSSGEIESHRQYEDHEGGVSGQNAKTQYLRATLQRPTSLTKN